LPDISIIHHAGQYLTLAESARPFRVTRDLRTLGPWDFRGGLPDGICAHPKIDPVTGELVVFRYGFAPPYLTWATVGPDGTVSQREQAIDLERPCMMHDFAVTEHYIILFVCPAVFDVTAAAVLQWQPELGTRIAVVPRRDSSDDVRWIDTEPFWVWHFANGFEADAVDGSITIIIDFPRWSHPGFDRSTPASCGVVRAEIDPTGGSIRIDQRDDELTEFPRIDDRRVGLPHRWFYVVSKERTGQALPPGEWNGLSRYDMQTGQVVTRRMGSLRLGEPVFVPAGSATAEDQGYVVTFATDSATLESFFLMLNAGDIAGEPAAILRIPHRVPAGLHGCWIPGK
jgi:carotenoid cleavage dioxygenase-like enzyme